MPQGIQVAQADLALAARDELNVEDHLTAISGDPRFSRERKIERLLEAGNRLFGTEFALISSIEGETYRVLHSQSEVAPAEPGTEFELGQTYCLQTYQSQGLVAYHNAGASELASHPCYSVFQLETYIGLPLLVDASRNGGKALTGTLNFSGTDAREPFSSDDFGAMIILGQQIQALL